MADIFFRVLKYALAFNYPTRKSDPEQKTISKLSPFWSGMGGFEKFCDAPASGDHPQRTNSDRPIGVSKELERQLRNNAQAQLDTWDNSIALKA